ncbi:hypothetical protein [Acetobacter fallax]|uniref:Uncharacterized protein n=1 Tax=Acetobacter fallax TaxID=1737473 RepID=A0ABX0K9J5_9PROT|nr:hypothetical protein [Acetobacter fallax]NHO31498.1 hypothetical protein [Acetobacter fallax]NHO35057.1 hypothetical protein [Acetobacter fallax]
MILFLIVLSFFIWSGIFAFYWRQQIHTWIDCRFDIFDKLRQRRAQGAEQETGQQNASQAPPAETEQT